MPAGTSLVVIGGSGTGKSVLLKCILGLIEPDAGTIEIDGAGRAATMRPRASATAARARIGMLFQNGALFDSLPVWENVAFGLLAAQRHRRRAEARGDAPIDVLAQVGLGRQRRRSVAVGTVGRHAEARGLARAIAAQPEICSSTSRPPASTRSWAR